MAEVITYVNLINRNIAPLSSLLDEIVKIDLDDYTATATCYLEVSAQNANVSAQTIFLDRDDNAEYTSPSNIISLSITGSTSTYTRFLSGSSTLSSTDIYYRFHTNSTDLTIQSARIVIKQDTTTNPLKKTVSHFEIGNFETLNNETLTDLAYPKYWRYEAAKFDPTPTFYVHVSAYVESDMYHHDLYLQEDDGNFLNWTSVLTIASTFTSEDATLIESSSFTPKDGRHYRLADQAEDSKGDIYISNAHIVAVISDATEIEQFQGELLLINTNETGTGLSEHKGYHDPADIDSYNLVAFNEVMASANGSEIKIQEDTDGTPSDLGNSIAERDLFQTNLARSQIETSDRGVDVYVPVYGGSGAQEEIGQSFQISSNEIIYAIDIRMSSTGTLTDNILCRITSTIGGTILGLSEAIEASTLYGNPQLVRFHFLDGVSLSASTTYYLEVYRSGSRDTSNFVSIALDESGDYADGQHYQKDSGSWAAQTGEDITFSIKSAMDLPSSADEIDAYVVTA